MRTLKTYPVNFARDPTLPTGVHDPLWRNPDVASRMSFDAFQRLLLESAFPDTPMLEPSTLVGARSGTVEKRTFATPTARAMDAMKLSFKGGGYGEIHRRYSFGGRLPTANFHAMSVCFGADSTGRYFLRAIVGRQDGAWGNSAALSLSFSTSKGHIGGIVWRHELDPPKDYPVLVSGRDARLQAAFDELVSMEVVFQTKQGTSSR